MSKAAALATVPAVDSTLSRPIGRSLAGRKPGSGLLHTQEIEDELIRRISSGEYMSNVCRDAHMPSVSTVHEWKERADLPLFGGRLASAQRDGFDALAGQLLLRSRQASTSMMADKDGNERVDPGMTGAIKLECDVALRLLPVWDARYAPQPAQTTVNVGVRVNAEWVGLSELRARMAAKKPDVEG